MPYLIYEAESRIPCDEISEVLQRSVGRPNRLGLPPKDLPFFGKVTPNGFKIMRTIRGRDSFNPMLFGRFHPSKDGTHVKVVMTFHPLIWFFLLAWTGFHSYWMYVGYRDMHRINQFDNLTFLIFPWIMAVPFFYINVVKSKDALEGILKLYKSD